MNIDIKYDYVIAPPEDMAKKISIDDEIECPCLFTHLSKQKVILPKELTAENGAKYLLIGEFFEQIEVQNENYCGCGECSFCYEFPDEPETILQSVPIEWTTIKLIYKKIVDHYGRLDGEESKDE